MVSTGNSGRDLTDAEVEEWASIAIKIDEKLRPLDARSIEFWYDYDYPPSEMRQHFSDEMGDFIYDSFYPMCVRSWSCGDATVAHAITKLGEWQESGFPVFEFTQTITECLLGTELPPDKTESAELCPYPASIFTYPWHGKSLRVLASSGPHSEFTFPCAISFPLWLGFALHNHQIILDLVKSSLAYINSYSDDVRPRDRKKKKRPRRDRERRPVHHFVVGRSIKIPNPIAAAARGRASSSYKILSRFMVRGHWRNQACGHGRKDRRLKWILPHWKGPDMDEALTRNYIVRSRKNAQEANVAQGEEGVEAREGSR